MPRTYGLTVRRGYRHQMVLNADKTFKSLVKKGVGSLAMVKIHQPDDSSNVNELDMSIDAISNSRRPRAGVITEVHGTALYGGKVQRFVLKHYGEYHTATIQSR